PHPTDINVDPLFQDMANGDYRLRWDSPCIDAGTNEGAPTTDIEGRVRPMDGNHDGIAIADIGAYESPMPVAVDVLHDTIRLQPNKLVQVAILSDPVFNALSVDPKTVVFGSGNAKEVHGRGHPEDVNGDGLTDLLFHFSCAESGIVPGYQTVFLQGKLMSGEDIVGADGVMGIPR
ncbi:MAG TPA: choice-of-anchor Q domain-containing protein, partial [Armatimonadota bacterium]|nr:choice-of-anchor Q domain-containing protein [Armatimonadota bacterium]